MSHWLWVGRGELRVTESLGRIAPLRDGDAFRLCPLLACPNSTLTVWLWQEWADWGVCSASCGTGVSRRTRERKKYEKHDAQNWSFNSWTTFACDWNDGFEYSVLVSLVPLVSVFLVSPVRVLSDPRPGDHVLWTVEGWRPHLLGNRRWWAGGRRATFLWIHEKWQQLHDCADLWMTTHDEACTLSPCPVDCKMGVRVLAKLQRAPMISHQSRRSSWRFWSFFNHAVSSVSQDWSQWGTCSTTCGPGSEGWIKWIRQWRVD